MTNLEKKIEALPPEAREEIFDFIEFISRKYRKKKLIPRMDEKTYWLKASEQSVAKVWDNEDDDVYCELLKR